METFIVSGLGTTPEVPHDISGLGWHIWTQGFVLSPLGLWFEAMCLWWRLLAPFVKQGKSTKGWGQASPKNKKKRPTEVYNFTVHIPSTRTFR